MLDDRQLYRTSCERPSLHWFTIHYIQLENLYATPLRHYRCVKVDCKRLRILSVDFHMSVRQLFMPHVIAM